ncbi:MAG TPA: transcription elongation factor GreA [Gemmataceae bacterium]
MVVSVSPSFGRIDSRSDGAMPEDRIPMTREGYDKLRADLDRMQGSEMIEVTKRVANARSMGDLSENAEYHAAREDQGILQAKINELKDRLSRATIVEKSNLPSDTVVFGARVRVKDLDYDEEEIFELVGPGDEDYDNNKILITSPIGQGLLGKRVGEQAEIPVPKGTIRYEVLEISPS